MLHCSNMSILNRATGSGPDYTADGRLEGGLDALERLGTALEGVNETGNGNDEVLNEVTPARDLPVSSSGSTNCSLTGSDDEGEGSTPERAAQTDSSGQQSGRADLFTVTTSSEDEEDEPSTPKQMAFDDMAHATDKLNLSAEASYEPDVKTAKKSPSMRQSTIALADVNERETSLPVVAVGDLLKQMYIEHRVLFAVVVSLFDSAVLNISDRVSTGPLFRTP